MLPMPKCTVAGLLLWPALKATTWSCVPHGTVGEEGDKKTESLSIQIRNTMIVEMTSRINTSHHLKGRTVCLPAISEQDSDFET